MLPPCVQHRHFSGVGASGASPVGVKEDVDERGGDGRQRVRVQRHDTELVLGDQHWMDCRLDGWKRTDSVSHYRNTSSYTLPIK